MLAASQINAEEATTKTGAKPKLATVQEMIDAREDVWGDAAMREPNGASYEFFRDLLPPLRWVNADFRHYPIVLSAPRAAQKARLVSNGSAINQRANKPPMWHEQGTPVTFSVGDAAEAFGAELARLEGPRYQDGYLPVVSMSYRQNGTTYREEVFALVDPAAAEQGAAMVRFKVVDGDGKIEARIASEKPLAIQGGEVLNASGKCLAAFTAPWQWNPDSKALVASLRQGETAELAVFTKPAEPGMKLSRELYDSKKNECLATWQESIARSTQLSTPEPIVDNAWRATLIGNFMIAVGDRPHYSAGNAYAKLYEAECGDTLRSIMEFGHLDVAPAMLKPLLEFNREATRFHVAGHKLQLLAWYYWMTRDAETVRAYRPLWQPSIDLILTSREKETGLLPKDRYAGDIETKVYSLNSNANCWRALRDLAAVLDELGEAGEAKKLHGVAAEYRQAILGAVEKSERRDAKPPFIPVALLADEPAHDPLTATRTGSYYDLICPYIIGSEIFGQGSQREDWLLGYLQRHGGIALGMVRTMPSQGQFENEPGVVPLYGLRYQMALLRRDEREKALVGFYGHLAQGMTRDTFIGGEGARFVHGDENGRSFYLPPNSSSNAAWLIALRNLLVQDWDLDEDGKPETLRLLYAAPRRWLQDGERIVMEKAPTAFGETSFRVESKLSEGYVTIEVTPPPRPVKTLLLRAPLPAGWRIESTEVDGKPAPLIDGDSINISGTKRPTSVRFKVKRA